MNHYGRLFHISIYGESHGEALGVIIDGMPSGIKIDQDLIQKDMERRQPKAIGTTPRKEADVVNIISGVYQGFSTGAPLHLMIENTNTRSQDYDRLKSHPRPGHADFVADKKYHGFQDPRGGGHFSGRLTAAVVAAGAIAKMIIPFDISSKLVQLGECTEMDKLDDYVMTIQKEQDSVAGIIEIKATHMTVGLGEPFFGKLDAEIGKMMFSIPAVKGVEIGVGFRGITMKGSEFNDLIIDENGTTKTNHSGGISGGISNGNDVIIRVMIKPASSISKPQETYHFGHEKVETLDIGGRHDVAIARRAGIVLENALAIVLADLYLINKAYQ